MYWMYVRMYCMYWMYVCEDVVHVLDVRMYVRMYCMYWMYVCM